MALNDETTYAGAIRRALREELARDAHVCLIGEEVGFGAGGERPAYGLLGEFGPDRVMEVPASGSALIGAATGLALMGLRPVVELPFAAMSGESFSQIVAAAQLHWRTAGTMHAPLVIRAPYGTHADPWRATSPDAWFAGVPGLRIVIPSTPFDALGLLKAAIRDNNPVLFLEGHYFYRRLREVLTEADVLVPLGSAEIRRDGEDVTLLTWGAAVYTAMEAAERVAVAGISTEVIDLRTVLPYDAVTVAESIRRTGRVLIVQDAPRTGGIGAEIAASIAEAHGAELRVPLMRVAAPDVPFPAALELAAAFAPDVMRVSDALHTIMEKRD
ncbi:MAG: alpha-ketoacid dehydrogenase subunit beta [Ktedonobacterales bacterium]|nr:alpha-ketoacid dehydrogenase subunit beta [Ktedonobacterales bacterium]